MSDVTALRELLQGRFFANWVGFVDAARVTESEGSLHTLLQDLNVLGESPNEQAARRSVDACLQRFNKMDDGWICTMEREDICDQVHRIVQTCGFECDDDWLSERDW